MSKPVASIDPTSAEGASLRQCEEQFRQIVETVSDVFWITSADAMQLLYVSPAYETIWGRTCESLYERPLTWMEAVHPADRAGAMAAFQQATQEGGCCVEFRIVRPDGSIRWVRDRAFPVRDQEGTLIRIAGVAEDITEWKQLQEQLRASQEHNRLISELTADYAHTSRIEPDGALVVETLTEGFTRVAGYTFEEFDRLGGWSILIHPADMSIAVDLNSRLSNLERLEGEIRIVTKSGEVRWIRYSSQVLRSVPNGRVDRMVGAVQDVTERRLAQERLRELSRRLLEVQEQDRRRLARELHDEVAQHLTALSLNLEAAEGPNRAESRRGLEQARALVNELATRVRELSLQLRPTMLDDLGLIPALLWLFDRYATRHRLNVHFDHDGLSRELGPEVETAAYRIVQEALTNVARHSGANTATVRAWLTQDQLHLTIDDRGRGFDSEHVPHSDSSAGLCEMQERAALLRGELTVESILGQGTRIAVVIPVTHAVRGERL